MKILKEISNFPTEKKLFRTRLVFTFNLSRINSVGLSGVSDDEAREELCRSIDEFVESIALAGKQISITAGEKIRDNGDVILTYGW